MKRLDNKINEKNCLKSKALETKRRGSTCSNNLLTKKGDIYFIFLTIKVEKIFQNSTYAKWWENNIFECICVIQHEVIIPKCAI